MRIDALRDHWPSSHDAVPRPGLCLFAIELVCVITMAVESFNLRLFFAPITIYRIPSFSIRLLMQLVIHYF